MLDFIRRMFRRGDPRFSDDLRWVMAKAHRFAVASGAPALTTAHVIAALARHPKGQAALGARAALVRRRTPWPSGTPTAQ